MYKRNQPQFFKIILYDSLSQCKLGIPKKFVRYYGHNLSNCVILKVPTGQKWKVGILKANGQIWLDSRWKEFMEFYSIVVGSFLVFQYDESISGFNVTIFDRTSTEIDYPYTINTNEPRFPKDESEIPVEISAHQFSPSRKRKEKSVPLSSSSSPPHKKMKKLENFANTTGKKGTKPNNENRSLPTLKQKMNTRKAIHHRASCSSESEKPAFKIMMHQSHLHDHIYSKLEIPSIFARKYMMKKDGKALLNVSDGRTWCVKYYTTLSGKTRTKLYGSSLRKFAQDNHLQIGDLCRFELIDPQKILFRVVISRLGSGSSSRESIDEETSILLQRSSSSSNSPKPFFRVVITSSVLEKGGLNVPINFIRNLEETTQNAKLLFYGKMWILKLLVYPSYGKATLSAGWREFLKENLLKMGDVCTFELIDDTQELVMKVSISKD